MRSFTKARECQSGRPTACVILAGERRSCARSLWRTRLRHQVSCSKASVARPAGHWADRRLDHLDPPLPEPQSDNPPAACRPSICCISVAVRPPRDPESPRSPPDPFPDRSVDYSDGSRSWKTLGGTGGRSPVSRSSGWDRGVRVPKAVGRGMGSSNRTGLVPRSATPAHAHSSASAVSSWHPREVSGHAAARPGCHRMSLCGVRS